jgi:hypothetical protein
MLAVVAGPQYALAGALIKRATCLAERDLLLPRVLTVTTMWAVVAERLAALVSAARTNRRAVIAERDIQSLLVRGGVIGLLWALSAFPTGFGSMWLTFIARTGSKVILAKGTDRTHVCGS